GRYRGRAGQGVVERDAAADGDTADGDRLVVADVLVDEERGHEGHCERVARGAVVGQGDARAVRAVVDLVLARGTDGQRPGRDVSGGGGRRAGQSVVARVGAADGDAADGDRLVIGNVLVVEQGAGEGRRQAVARDAVVGQIDRGDGVTVVDLV